MEYNYLEISQINNYIKNLIDKDYFLNKVYVKGEISNFKNHARGHLYFTLKDDNSRINAVMFASSAKTLDFIPGDGNQVLIEGRISCYPASGSYQIYVEKMTLDGIGRLFIEYEKLKKKLAGEGLFNKEHKKLIPKYPMKVGVITADTGAAIKDIVSTIKRRFPICQVILFPSLVQGPDAKYNIVNQIKKADTFNLDTIIVGRGGGSIEDLWAFNEECVAMAIFRCETPVISAVGHETDFTIADFVADLRAPTPSAAAELAVFEYDTFENTLNLFAAQLSQSMQALIESRKKELEHAKLSLKVSHPSVRLKAQSETLKQYEAQIKRQIMHLIDQKKAQLSIAAAKLEAQSPLKKVGGGYAFLTDENKKPVCSVNQMTPQTTFFAYLSDGIVQADVTKCMPKDKME